MLCVLPSANQLLKGELQDKHLLGLVHVLTAGADAVVVQSTLYCYT